MSHLTVRTMSKLSGVSAHTLRAWEKRYGALKPSRTTGGQRAYNMQDLDRLRRLKHLTEAGFSIGQIARLDESELIKMMPVQTVAVPSAQLLPGLQVVSLPTHTPEDFNPPASTFDREPVEGLINDLAEFRLDEVYRGLTAARMRFGARDFALNIAAPLLTEIGVLVDSGSMSISQEHAFSALLRDQLGHLIQSSRSLGARDSIVFATSEGDFHEFGILLGQVLALSHGLKCHNLGANLPVDSLIFASRALNADHIIVSFADLSAAQFRSPIPQFLKTLRQNVPKHTTIMIGGRGIHGDLLEQVRDQAVFVPSLHELDNILKRISTHKS